MPTFTVQFPDGAKYDVDAPEGTTDAQAYSYAVSHLASLPDPITRQSTFGEEVERGVARTLDAKRLGIEQLIGDDSNQAIVDSIARGQETAEGLGIPPSLERLQDIAQTKGYGAAAAELPGDITRYGGQQVGVLGTLGTGARLASWLMPGGALLKGLAGGLGGISALTPDLAASSMERLAQEQMARGEEVDVDVGEAYKYAAMQAALEAGGTALFLGRNILRAITGIGRSAGATSARQIEQLRKAAEISKTGATARGLARGMPEIPIEIGQQILERDFAGLDLLSDEALSEYGEAAYAAGLVGGSFGVTGSFADRLVAGQAIAPTPQQEAIQAIQDVALPPEGISDAEATRLKNLGYSWNPQKNQWEKTTIGTAAEQTVAQATGQETVVGTETTPTETIDTETTDTETTDTETTDTENREETRKAAEETRKEEEKEKVEAVTTATEENVKQQQVAETTKNEAAESIAERERAAEEQRTAERAYAKDIAARRENEAAESIAERERAAEEQRTAERAYAKDIAARRETEGFTQPDYSQYDRPTVQRRDEEVADTVVVEQNGREKRLSAVFAAALEEVVDETVVDETVVDETVVPTVATTTGLDTIFKPLLTEQNLKDARINKKGVEKLVGTGAFREGIEVTNENITAQIEALKNHATSGVSKRQSDNALSEAEILSSKLKTRKELAETSAVVNEEGERVNVSELEESAPTGVDEDVDVLIADSEITPVVVDDSALVDADLQALNEELQTNPSGDVAAYLDPEPSIGGFIANLNYTTNLEQQARVEKWINDNLSRKINAEYTSAKKERIKNDPFSDIEFDFLLLDSVSKLSTPVNPEVVQALQEGNLAQALTALRVSQGRKDRDVARLISALSKAVGATQIELRSNVVDQFGRPAAGYFSPRTNTIVINQDVAISTHTLLHEVTHAVVSAQLATNSPASRQMKALFESVKDRLGTAYGAQDVDEFVAEAWGNPEFRAELGRIAIDNKGTTALQRFLNSVMNMIRKIRGLPAKSLNSAQSEVDILMEELIAPAPEFRNADDLFLAATPSEQKNILVQSLASITGKVTNRDVEEVGDFLTSANALRRKATLGILPLDSIARLAEREFPALAAAIRELFSIINQKRGSRNELLEKIRGTAREVKEAFKNDPEARILFGELTTESTRLGYDPTKERITYEKFYYTYFNPKTDERQTSVPYNTQTERDDALEAERKKVMAANPEAGQIRFLRRDPEDGGAAMWQYVRDMYNRLTPPQQQAYVTLRDAYEEMFNELKVVLLKRIDAIEADDTLKKDFRNKILYDILYRQEISPYFPLSRAGNLWLVYQGVDPYTFGVATYKETFTTVMDRNKRVRELRADPTSREAIAQTGMNPDGDEWFHIRDVSEQDNIADFVGTEFAYGLLSQVQAVGKEAVKNAEQAVLKAGGTQAEATEAGRKTAQARADMEKITLEAIVRASPERSLLRTFQPRAGTLGYDTDAIDTFEHRMPIFANQVNTLRYALPLEQIGVKIKKTAGEATGNADTKQYASDIAEHVQGYIEFAQNPNISNWSKLGKSLTFLWTLGFNVASAIINLFILPTVVYAYLGGKYGYGKTASYMVRNIGRYFQTGTSRDIKRFGGDPLEVNRFQGPGLGNPDYSSADLPEGLKDYEILATVLKEEGYDNQTTIGDMLDTDTPVSTGINNVMGYVFNQTERLNRHVTAMTFYDLEIADQQTKRKKDGKPPLTDEERKQIARKSILEAEYTNSGASIDTAPRVSQNDVGSLAFMYKRFGVSMMFFQIQTFRDALSYVLGGVTGRNKQESEAILQEKKAALKQGAMLFATTALLAGAQGVPMIGTVRFLWNMLKEDDEEDFDSWLKDITGEPVFYEGVLNELTGADIAPRIAMNQLLHRTMPNQADQSLMEDAAELLGGPSLSLLTRMFGENGTLELWKDGAAQNRPELYYRGLERALPSSFANIMRGNRYLSEGAAKSLRGDVILEDITTGGLVGQFLGFAPADYTRQLEQNARDKSIDMAISTSKRNLLGRLNFARRNQTVDRTVERDIMEFNSKHPETAITSETRERSWNAFKNMDADMGVFSGVRINPQRQRTVLLERMDNLP